MGFLSPWWLLAGVVGAGLPVWLHLLQQHKQEPFPFASTMFFERRTESTTYQRRLKYKFLMSLRLLLLLLLALAFAQPFLRQPPALLNAGNALTVLVIDNSFSMRGSGLLDKAKAEARSAVASAGQAQVWSLGSRVIRLAQTTTDKGELLGAVESVGPTDEKSSYAELGRSLRDASRSTGRPLKVTFFTDAQRTALPPSFTDLALEPGTDFHVVEVGRKEANYAVEAVNAPRTLSDLTKVKINATITAFNAPAAKRTVVLKINGKQVATKTVDVPQDGRASVEFTGLEGPYGWLRGEVSITDADALPQDNQFYFAVERADPRKVLFIDEQRAAKPALYFRAALEASAQAFFAVEEMSPGNAANANLANYAFVVLHDPGVNAKGMEANLKKFVEGGGSLWIAAGPQTASLPSLPVAGFPINGTRFASNLQRYFSAANVDPTYPSLRRTGRLEGVRFFQAVIAVPPADAIVAAKLEDGTPLLIEKKLGEGKVIVFTSSFDNTSNDLPVKPNFVPFVEQTAAYLGAVEEKNSLYAVDSYLDLRSDKNRSSSVEVIGPSGERALTLKESATANSLRLADSGFYDVRRENNRQELIAVNVDRRESDLDHIAKENLDLWQQTGKSAAAQTNAGVETVQPEPKNFWWWAAFLAFLILLAETWVSARYLQATS